MSIVRGTSEWLLPRRETRWHSPASTCSLHARPCAPVEHLSRVGRLCRAQVLWRDLNDANAGECTDRTDDPDLVLSRSGCVGLAHRSSPPTNPKAFCSRRCSSIRVIRVIAVQDPRPRRSKRTRGRPPRLTLEPPSPPPTATGA